MTSIHRFSALGLALATAGLAAPALAQDSYTYFGLGVGQARAHIDDTRIGEALLGRGLSTAGVAHDERHTAYKVFGGYQFNRYVGMELGFFHLGSFDFKAQAIPAGTLSGQFRVQGANLDLVGTLPFTENFSGLARVGAQYARTRAAVAGTGSVIVANPQPSDREVNPKVGLGLQYAFGRSVMVRGEVERYQVSDAVGNHPQVNTYSVSLVIPFGRSAGPDRRAALMPAYVPPTYVAQAPVMAPTPAAPTPLQAVTPAAPVVMAAEAPAPMAPQTRRVSYAAESFFGFDKAELRPEGKAALDSFVVELGSTRYDNITVQGHADRIGSTAYNQALSLERAEAVKAYLVSSARLDGTRIVATGRSESEPVTVPDACRGATSPAVIACLQPDRRVMIDVTGSR